MLRYIIFPFIFSAFVIYANSRKGGYDSAIGAALFIGVLIAIDLLVAY